MKKSTIKLIISCIIAAGIFTACDFFKSKSSDSEAQEEMTEAPAVAGEWKSESKVVEPGVSLKEETLLNLKADGTMTESVEFKYEDTSDGFISAAGTVAIDGTYTFDGQKLSLAYNTESFRVAQKFKINVNSRVSEESVRKHVYEMKEAEYAEFETTPKVITDVTFNDTTLAGHFDGREVSFNRVAPKQK